MTAITITDLSNAKADVDHIAALANSPTLTATDRLGVTKRTMAGIDAAATTRLNANDAAEVTARNTRNSTASAQISTIQNTANLVLAGFGYAPPVAYAAGLSMTLATQTVSYAGQTYAPILSSLPFTTSGTFETAKFRLIQGATYSSLAAATGASLVGYGDNTVSDVLNALQFTAYSDLRTYSGPRKNVFISGQMGLAAPAKIGGQFVVDLTDTTSADNGGTIIVDASSRRWKRVCGSGVVEAEWFGVVGDGVTDNYTALVAAINSFTTAHDYNGYSMAGEVLLPVGVIYIGSTLTLHRQVKITGPAAPAGNSLGICKLLFPDNVDGIVIFYQKLSTPLNSADGCLLRGFSVISKADAAGTLGSGIVLNARAELKNVLVTGFRKDGFHVEADTSVGPNNNNANNWRMENCLALSNGRHGLYVVGGDANAGNCIGLSSRNNGGWGLYDSSFLGNTYTTVHTEANTLGGYKADNLNARNVFLGCYSEGGEVQSIVSPSIVIGGILAAARGALGTCQWLGENASSKFIVGSSDAKSVLGLGSNFGVTSEVFALKDLAEVGGVWPFRMKGIVGGFAMDWANSTVPVLRLANSRATIANGYPRDISDAIIGFDRGFTFGQNLNFFLPLNAAPTSGTYLRGDTAISTSPSAGGTFGWSCVTAGSPGVWKPFGAIGA